MKFFIISPRKIRMHTQAEDPDKYVELPVSLYISQREYKRGIDLRVVI